MANNLASSGRAIFSTLSPSASRQDPSDLDFFQIPIALFNSIVSSRDLNEHLTLPLPGPRFGDADIRGFVVSGGNNLIDLPPSDTTYRLFVTPGATDILGEDPLIAQLADNGGFAPTHALLLGSPAIDNGRIVDQLPIDQRGVARPQGAAPNIGAFEVAEFDYGDAPEGFRRVIDPPNDGLQPHVIEVVTYWYNNVFDGARHALVADGPVLGERVDGEPNSQPSTDASGDGDDEDGILSPLDFTPGQSTTITVSTITGGVLNA